MALIPSMFVRRLVLIGVAVGLAMVVPALRLGQLTVLRGSQLAADAEKKLVSETWGPTSRGRILDRKGRVLAMDRPSYDVAVDYEVLTGEWSRSAAVRKARSVYRSRWGALTPVERLEMAEQFRPAFEQAVEAMWARLAAAEGVTVAHVLERRDDIVGEVNAAVVVVDEQRRRKEAEQKRARELAAEGDNGDAPEVDTGGDQAPAQAVVPTPTPTPTSTPAPTPPAPGGPKPKRTKLKEETIAHVVLSNVSDQVAFELGAMSKTEGMTPRQVDESVLAGRLLPGVSVVDGRTREYPLETMEVQVDRRSFPQPLKSEAPVKVKVRGVATHLLGWMRGRIYKEDIERRPREQRTPEGTLVVDRGHYRPGDSVGAAGLEGVCEDELRGLRSFKRVRLDTGDLDQSEDATPGKDIPLTIDARLQARIQALFDPGVGLAVVQAWHKNHNLSEGTVLTGGAVVIDVDSGDVLAMVSEPSFTREQLRRDPDSVLGASLEMPRLNRSISKPYQPGSIVKPLMLCGAITEGVYKPEQRVACNGHFIPNEPNMLRCWIYKQFNTTHSAQLGHDLDGSDAIMASCNIFFFEMGKRLGPVGLVKWYEKFGVGPASRYWDLGTFARPHPPKEREPGGEGEDNERSPWQLGGPKGPSASEAIQMAIGQGPIAWTPMHAADAYATIARGGVRVRPHVRSDVAPGPPENLGIDPRAIEMALTGLRRGVEEDHGTANHLSYDMPGAGGETRSVREPVFTVLERGKLAVWAKTGTADASKTVVKEEDGRVIEVDGDHSWTVCLVGEKGDGGNERPRYAVAVVVDYAGSGGRVAGPIANQVIKALVAEGYLKDDAAGEPGGQISGAGPAGAPKAARR
jgi:penicillin-binding protein 2